jgi:AraC-like DNA-binding protein
MLEYCVESALILGTITIVLLIFFRKKGSKSNHFLALSLFCIWYSLLLSYLNLTSLILHYPILIRTGNITGYLVLIFLYIYARNTFYPGIYWRKKDWLFILPALFYIIDMWPFYFSSAAYKIEVMRYNLQNPAKMFRVAEGWIHINGFHFVFRYIWGIFMMFLLVRLIARNWRFITENTHSANRRLYLFIVILTALQMPLIFPGIIGAVFHLHWFNISFVTLDLSVVLISSSLFFLASPTILYGFLPTLSLKGLAEDLFAEDVRLSESKKVLAKDELQEQVYRLPDREMQQIILKMEGFMNEQTPFLKADYTIHDLGRDIGIPVYHLSPIINQYYKCNFSSWVNKYRINYFINLYDQDKNRALTLDALAKESGFSNRTTFTNAFKKIKNQTPAVYLKQDRLGGQISFLT